jgi:hypothetical protein
MMARRVFELAIMALKQQDLGAGRDPEKEKAVVYLEAAIERLEMLESQRQAVQH